MKKNIPFIYDFINLFFPDVCPVCGDGLLRGENIMCVPCLLKLPRTNFHMETDNKTCELFAGRVPFKAATSFFYYNKFSKYSHLIHEMKYNGKTEIGSYLGSLLGNELRKTGFSKGIDLIIPVPLHRKRLIMRGFNQSECIAQGISKATKIPVETKVIKRTVNTSTQTAKNKQDRTTNMENVFELISTKELENKHVLLVDDVITTGATIESLAKSIENIEGIKISIASLGIASFQ